MRYNAYRATALILLVACQLRTAAAEESTSSEVPPIVPAKDELPILGIPAFSIHQELENCLKDAATILEGEGNKLEVRLGVVHRYYSQRSGFILRADFVRADVQPPRVNRIVCWHTGQVIASHVSVPPLPPEASEKALAVPRARLHN